MPTDESDLAAGPLRASRLSRRALVALGGAGLVGLLVPGCSSSPGGPPGPSDDDDDDSAGTGGSDDDDSGGSEPDDDDSSSEADDDDTGAPCSATDDNIQGPFYVSDAPVRSDLDLYDEKGIGLTVSGQVLDVDCNPIEGAVLEIWHADPTGGYDNDSAAMRYRGQMATDSAGSYSFSTLVPGHYLNGPTYRPAHIHAKLWVDGAELLTTQLYFRDDPYNDGDAFIEKSLIMDFTTNPVGDWIAVFDFVLALP